MIASLGMRACLGLTTEVFRFEKRIAPTCQLLETLLAVHQGVAPFMVAQNRVERLLSPLGQFMGMSNGSVGSVPVSV